MKRTRKSYSLSQLAEYMRLGGTVTHEDWEINEWIEANEEGYMIDNDGALFTPHLTMLYEDRGFKMVMNDFDFDEEYEPEAEISDTCHKCGCNEFLCGHNQKR